MEKKERSLRPRKKVDYTKTHIDYEPAWLGVRDEKVDGRDAARHAAIDGGGGGGGGGGDVKGKTKMGEQHKKKLEKSRKAPREAMDVELARDKDKKEKRKVKFAQKHAEVPKADAGAHQTIDIFGERGLPGEKWGTGNDKTGAKGSPSAALKKRRQERGPSELEVDFSKKQKREKAPPETAALATQKKEASLKPFRGGGPREQVEGIDSVREAKGGPSNPGRGKSSDGKAGKEPPTHMDAQQLSEVNEERSIILSPNRTSDVAQPPPAHLRKEDLRWLDDQRDGRKKWLAENARKVLDLIDVSDKAVQLMQDATMFWQKESEKQALFAVGGKETAARLQQARAEITEKDSEIAQKGFEIAQKDAEIAQKDADIAQKDAQVKEMMEKLRELENVHQMATHGTQEPSQEVNVEGGQAVATVAREQAMETPCEVQNCSVAVQVDPQSPSLVAEKQQRQSFATLSRRVSEGTDLDQAQPKNQTRDVDFSFCTSPGGGRSRKQSLVSVNPMMDERTIEIQASAKVSAPRHSVISLLSADETPMRKTNMEEEHGTLPRGGGTSEKFESPVAVRRRTSMVGSGPGRRLSMVANDGHLPTIPESRVPLSTHPLPRHSNASFQGQATASPNQRRMSNSRLSYGPLENLEHLGFDVELRDGGLFHSHAATGYCFWIGESNVDPQIWLQHENENIDQLQDDFNFQQIAYKPYKFGDIEDQLPLVLKESVTFLRSSAAKFAQKIEEALDPTGQTRLDV